MSDEKTILLNGFKDADKVVFNSLLSLLSFKTKEEWALTNHDDQYDLAIVDTDTRTGQSKAMELENQGRAVVCFGAHAFAQSRPNHLGKPLRANDILKCLNGLTRFPPAATVLHKEKVKEKPPEKEPVATTHQHEDHHFGYRLSRWPDRRILAAFPGSSRLCAVLMRHSITAEKAAQMADLPLVLVKEFIEKCRETQCLSERLIDFDTVNAPKEKPKKHSHLFSRLRMKFATRN